MRRQRLHLWFDAIDLLLTNWMTTSGLSLLRISVGIVFLWFGVLTFMPSIHVTEVLLHQALWFVPTRVFLPFFGTWEIAIGVGLIIGKWMRLCILLLIFQTSATLFTAFLAPERIWATFPLGLTLEGQSTVKDLVFLSAGLVLGATVRGGGLIQDSIALAEARAQ